MHSPTEKGCTVACFAKQAPFNVLKTRQSRSLKNKSLSLGPSQALMLLSFGQPQAQASHALIVRPN